MKNWLLITVFLVLISCDVKKKDSQDRNTLFVSRKSGLDLLEDTTGVLLSKDYASLNELGGGIVRQVGLPVSRQDSLSLKFAYKCFCRSLMLKPTDRLIFRNKINVLAICGNWEESTLAINEWITKNESKYYLDYMLKGFSLINIDNKEESQQAFNEALFLFEKGDYHYTDIKNQIQRIVILLFIEDKNAVNELNKYLELVDDPRLIYLKELTEKGFNQKNYINEFYGIRRIQL